MKKVIWKNIAQGGFAIGFLLLAWGVAYLVVGNELLVPSFSDCFAETAILLKSGRFWRGFFGSFARAMAAFGLSFFVALSCGVLAYIFPLLQGVFAPVVSAFRSLPVMAVLLVLLTLFGGAGAPVAVAFLSLFPMLYTGILSALSGVDKQLIELSQVYGASKSKRVFGVYLPLSAPYILREMGAGASFSLKLVVSAEVLANTAKSLGGMMQEARVYAEVARLFSLVGAAFITGLLLEVLFAVLTLWAEKRVK